MKPNSLSVYSNSIVFVLLTISSKSDVPIRAGLITATTHDSYYGFKRAWKSTAFLSRVLPFSFSHSVATTEGIMNAIDTKAPDPIEAIRFAIKKKPQAVTCPDSMLRQLRAYEEMLSKSTGSLPYRHQIQLNAITEALVIQRGHIQITQEDIDTIAWLSKWINYEFKQL